MKWVSGLEHHFQLPVGALMKCDVGTLMDLSFKYESKTENPKKSKVGYRHI